MPLIGYALASLLLAERPLLMVGLVIYFMSCTDWFLGFTHLAGGNVALGAALILINMTLQLLLHPLYLSLFAQHAVDTYLSIIGEVYPQPANCYELRFKRWSRVPQSRRLRSVTRRQTKYFGHSGQAEVRYGE
ncbi:hypothetical protein [Halomonas cupida]|uniref:hypothetical protein n=1 Tax=Halomonas cupida TaxID=44933 RepID=UPI003A8E253E